jgi:hypothetical protein
VKILFDQGVPVPLRKWLAEHEVSTAAQMGWQELSNGSLLATAEAAGFNAFITTDRNLRYQQNLAARAIAILVLAQQQWPRLEPHALRVAEAVATLKPASFVELDIS